MEISVASTGNTKLLILIGWHRRAESLPTIIALAPICSPSRVGLLTGMTPAKWNITSFLQKKADNRLCEQADYLSVQAPSIARLLKSNGYATGLFWEMAYGRWPRCRRCAVDHCIRLR